MAERRHFETDGEAYARHRPTYPPALAQALAAMCARTDHALDVGCGTGQLSTLLAASFARVTATDPSQSQIASAAPHPRVTYAVEPAEAIGLADGSVDLVVAAQAAHWFDLEPFYAEARRVARPGAVLALISYGVPELEGEPGARFEGFYWGEVHRFWPPERAHVEKGYATLAFPFPEIPLPPLAIERSWSLADLLGYIETWSATKPARAAGQGALIERLAADLAQVWGEGPRAVRWPLIGRVARLP